MTSSRSFIYSLVMLTGITTSSPTIASDKLGAISEAKKASAVVPQLTLGEIAPSVSFTQASFAVAGAGLRNRLLTSVNMLGDPTIPPRAAYLYWAVISNGAVPVAARSPKIARRSTPTVGPTARQRLSNAGRRLPRVHLQWPQHGRPL
jgi:hypothetical protein